MRMLLLVSKISFHSAVLGCRVLTVGGSSSFVWYHYLPRNIVPILYTIPTLTGVPHDEGRFAREILPVDAPLIGGDHDRPVDLFASVI